VSPWCPKTDSKLPQENDFHNGILGTESSDAKASRNLPVALALACGDRHSSKENHDDQEKCTSTVTA
jgi:hypothetical protein